MDRFWRLFHTVRFLHWRQIWFRLYYRVRPLRVVSATAAPPRREDLSLIPSPWGARATEDGRRFEFLGEAGSVETAEDWNAPRFSKLWLYNLHYFNDLNAPGSERWAALDGALLDRWITDNPPARGNGWVLCGHPALACPAPGMHGV